MNDLLNYGIFKYLWIVILMPKTIQFVILSVLSFYYHFKSGFIFNKVTVSFLSFIFIYILAIVSNLLINQEVDIERLFAAINVVGMWFFSLIAYCYYHQNEIDFSKVKRYMFINMLIMIFFSILFLFVRYRTNIFILGRPLAYTDWLRTGRTERFTGFLEYANLIALFYLIIFPLALLHIYEKRKIYFLLFIGFSFVPIITSNSRTTLAVMLFAVSFLLFFYLLKPRLRIIILLQLPIVVILIFILFAGEVRETLYNFFNARSGSNALRFIVYEESLRSVFQRSPLIGIGIRERFARTAHLGTHSTYVGIIFRTGILGSFLFFSQFLAQVTKLIHKLLQSGYGNFLGFVVAFLIVIMFEDIDGSNWVLYMLFICIGMMNCGQLEKQNSNI